VLLYVPSTQVALGGLAPVSSGQTAMALLAVLQATPG
jgi:hypothetical protein